jgi:hypothetical protein
MLGEFLSANVSTPFILNMVAGLSLRFCAASPLTSSVGFPEFKDDDSAAAAWTGVLGAKMTADTIQDVS